jgi:glycosyltransferase involved in cell wall biosynthesis
VRPNIVLSALALHADGSGVQTYCRELLRALPGAVDANLVAVVQTRAQGELGPGVASSVRRDCDGVRRTIEGLRGVGAADLVHGLDVDLPLRPGAPSVATVHDLSLFDEPSAFGWSRRVGKQVTTRASIRRADAVIAVSSFTAERIKARFGRDSHVVLEAPGPGFAPPTRDTIDAVRARYSLPDEFVLHVGNLEPRKDVPTLARACAQAGIALVLAGGHIVTVDAPAGAVLLGQVAPEDLPPLYAAATVVAYVSRYEGFGLPPIEAMACGATVMATRCGALPDVAGDGIEFVAAGDVNAQAGALRDLVNDPARRSERARAGFVAAARLSWDATATATVDVYRSLGVSGLRMDS